MNQQFLFLDIFTYEKIEMKNGRYHYINCTFLKDFRNVKKGTHCTHLAAALNLTGWEGTTCNVYGEELITYSGDRVKM
jgi:hypothetical protein